MRRTFPRVSELTPTSHTHGPALLLGDRYQPARSGRRSRPTGRDTQGPHAEGWAGSRAGRHGRKAGGCMLSSPWPRLLPPFPRRASARGPRAGRRREGGGGAAGRGPGAAERGGSERTSPRRACRSSPRAALPAARAPGPGRGRPARCPRPAPGTASPPSAARTAGRPHPRRPRTREAGSRGRPQPEGIARDRRSSPRHPPRRLGTRTPEAARTVRTSFSRFKGVLRLPLVLFNRPFLVC